MGERAVELMAERALSRTVFRRRMAEHGGFQQQLARCRINLDAARLTVLDAAHALDRVGNKEVGSYYVVSSRQFPLLSGQCASS